MGGKLEEIYDAMNSSGMVQWVGGGNPMKIGQNHVSLIKNSVPFDPDWSVLDFGCGLGRTSASMLDALSANGSLVGVDIVEPMVDFCDSHIRPRYGNAQFFATSTLNPLYEGRKTNTSSIDETILFRDFEGRFNLIYAFSVFTHLGPDDTEKYFHTLRKCLKPNGHFVFSAFLIDSLSASRINTGNAKFKCRREVSRHDDFIDKDPNRPLSLTAYSLGLLTELLFGAGFYVARVSYGAWRGIPADHGQDVIVARPDS